VAFFVLEPLLFSTCTQFKIHRYIKPNTAVVKNGYKWKTADTCNLWLGEGVLYLIYWKEYKNCMMPFVYIWVVVFYLEDEYHRFLQNVGTYLQEYVAS
jgi:hypothetical protein